MPLKSKDVSILPERIIALGVSRLVINYPKLDIEHQYTIQVISFISSSVHGRIKKSSGIHKDMDLTALQQHWSGNIIRAGAIDQILSRDYKRAGF